MTVIDLTAVPYMDSAGMGLVMNTYVRCQTKGVKLVVAGANSRVMDLFKVTKVDTVLPLVVRWKRRMRRPGLLPSSSTFAIRCFR